MKYTWNNKNKRRFAEALKNCHNTIEEITQRIEAGLVESTGGGFQKLFMDAAEISLEKKKTTRKNWKKRKKSKNGLIMNAKF